MSTPTAVTLRLGKRPPKFDPQTLMLARYVDRSALAVPSTSGGRALAAHTPLGMFLNNLHGDCTMAGRGNLRRFWASITGKPTDVVTDDDVIQAYSRVGGFNPANGANDNGCVELDVLNDWRKVPFAGETIDAYAAVNVHDDDLMRASIYLFDGLYGGYALPITAQRQLDAGEPFDVVAQGGSDAFAGSWGGHCMVELDYDEEYVYLGTWGQIVKATWAWVRAYRDEGYVILSRLDQLKADGRTAEQIDLEHLQSDLSAIAA